MSIKKRLFAAFTAVVLAVTAVMGLSGCSSQVNYAMEIDGEKIPAGLYILYSGYAYQQAQQKLAEEQPDLDTSAADFDFTAQKVSDMDFMDYVKQEAVNNCKRYMAVNNLFNELNITFDETEKDNINDSVNNQWNYEIPDWISSSMPYIVGFKTVGEYYESLGVAKSSFKLYVTNTFMASKIFTYYYGEGGIEEVPKADKEKWLEENYALSRYFPVSIKDSSGKVIESKTELALIKKKAEEYAEKLNKGESFKDVYNEYVEYSKEQASSAASTTTPAETSAETTADSQQGRAAEPAEDTTTAAVQETEPEEAVTTATAEETEPEEVTTAAAETTEPVEVTTNASANNTTTANTTTANTTAANTTAGTTAAETGGTTTEEVKDSDYDRVVNKDSTSPSEHFVKELFDMNKDEAKVIEEDTAYYVVQRLDILKSDQDYVTKYDSEALEGLKGDDMEAAFKKEYENYTLVENKSAPDYCKEQAENAANALGAVSYIQYLTYYYSSMLGGGGGLA